MSELKYHVTRWNHGVQIKEPTADIHATRKIYQGTVFCAELRGATDEFEVRLLKALNTSQLETYRAGLTKAAFLKANWHITEQDGVSALKREIREFAAAINTIPEP